MARGKQTCRILKEIRRQIADANGIEYAVSECKFKGNCLGTCPKCEAEVRYLEEQLEHRRLLGKAVVVAGISMNVIAASAAQASEPTIAPIDFQRSDTTEVVDSANLVTGRMVDKTGEPMIGGWIHIKGKEYDKDHYYETNTDMDGNFSFAVDSFPQTLIFSYIGYENTEITVTEAKHKRLIVTLKEDDNALLGEVVVIKKHKKSKKKTK